jgi:hypothetical protein
MSYETYSCALPAGNDAKKSGACEQRQNQAFHGAAPPMMAIVSISEWGNVRHAINRHAMICRCSGGGHQRSSLRSITDD